MGGEQPGTFIQVSCSIGELLGVPCPEPLLVEPASQGSGRHISCGVPAVDFLDGLGLFGYLVYTSRMLWVTYTLTLSMLLGPAGPVAEGERASVQALDSPFLTCSDNISEENSAKLPRSCNMSLPWGLE